MTKLSRRNVLVSGAAGLVVLSTACDLSTQPEGRDGGSGTTANGKEAPSLAALVEGGDLPPVEDRLPDKPAVIEPVERVGVYGGTWNTALLGAEDTAWLLRTMTGQDRILRWDLAWNEVLPNVVEAYEVDEAGTVYTFHLRPGLKWSDGEPLTTDDIMFWYEHVFSNSELTPVQAEYLTANGEPLVVEKVGDHSVQFTFAGPSGLFPQWLASYDESFRLIPAHYLEEFHPQTNPAASELASSEGFDSWVDHFWQKMDLWANPELPRVHAWVPTNAMGESSQLVFQRNPYYYKVDSEGRQLPYIDEVVFDVVSDEETLVLKAANGDLGMHARHINLPANKPVLAKSRETGGYHFTELKNTYLNTITLHLNLTHKDPVKREIFRNRDFRIGLSHAMNRQEIIDVVYQRQGRPWQIAPRPETPFADEEMGTQYTEYDPDLANEYLDRAGYSERNDQGVRLGPDGKPIVFTLLAQTRYFEMADALELIRKHWLAVGVDMRPQNVEGTLWTERVNANDHDGALDDGSPGYKDMVLDPRWLLTGSTGGNRYAPLWNNWYIGSGDMEEPTEPMKREIEIYREEVMTEPDADSQNAAMAEIVQIAKEQFWIMGISLPPNGYAIVRNDFHNVPDSMWEAARYPTPGPSNPCQYFISA